MRVLAVKEALDGLLATKSCEKSVDHFETCVLNFLHSFLLGVGCLTRVLVGLVNVLLCRVNKLFELGRRVVDGLGELLELLLG